MKKDIIQWKMQLFNKKAHFLNNNTFWWVSWVGVQTEWRRCIWMFFCCWWFFCCWVLFVCFKLKTLQERLRAFCRGLRGALVWPLQPANWLSCIKKWVIIFSNSSSQWLFCSTSHLTVSCPWIITGDILAHHWLGQWYLRVHQRFIPDLPGQVSQCPYTEDQ